MASLFSREIAEYAVLIFRLLSISRISNFVVKYQPGQDARTSGPLYPITDFKADYIHRWTMSSDPTTQTLVN